jgi:hypothetical protein
MIRNEYPHNRLQALLYRRKLRLVWAHLAFIFVLSLVFLFQRPQQASAAQLEYPKTGNWNQSAMVFGTAAINEFSAFTYKFVTTTQGLEGVTSIELGLIRDGGTTSGNLFVKVYRGGTSPETATLIATSNAVNAGTLSTSAAGNYVSFGFSTPFDLESNETYWFHIYRGSGTQQGTTYVAGWTSPTEGDICRRNISAVWECPYTGYGKVRVTGDALVSGSADLEVQTYAPYTVGQTIDFTANWSDLDFAPYYLYFFPDAEETRPVTVVENFPMELGQVAPYHWDFSYKFTSAHSWHTFAQLGNRYCTTVTSTGAITGSGCVLRDLIGPTLTVSDPTTFRTIDRNYTIKFEYSKTRDVIVGESVHYEYLIDPLLCSGSSISGRRLFKGYSSAIAYRDTGAVLSTNSGSGNIIYDDTNQPYSDFFYPYIHVYCANSSYARIYLGSTLTTQKAIGVSVYEADDIKFWYPENWLIGGETGNMYSGTGAGFWAEKKVYERHEPVKLRWEFNVPFTVAKVVLYPDSTETALFYEYTGVDDLTEAKYHHGQIEYSEEGEYQPMIQVRSASYSAGNPATYMNIYLGGNAYPLPLERLIVNAERYGIASECSDRGVFGLSASGSLALDMGEDANIFIKSSLAVFNKTINGIAWASGYAFCFIEDAPVFSFITDIIRPEPGGPKVLPATYFGQTFDLSKFDRQFTIAYQSPSGNLAFLLTFMRLGVAIAVITYTIRKLI